MTDTQSYYFTSQGEGRAVTPDTLYDTDKGYGFVTEENRKRQPALQIPEVNSGFEPAQGVATQTVIAQDEGGCFVDAAEMWQKEGRQLPLCFKCDVPVQGNYRVTLTIRPGEDMNGVRIFMGRRRLVDVCEKIPAGSVYRKTFPVNVCNIIPDSRKEILEERSVNLTVTADRPCISSVKVEPFSCPVLFIAGDSTVTDQRAEYPFSPMTSYAGWGQMLPAFLNGSAAVSNHAHSGLTTETFRQEGHWSVVKTFLKPGDYVFFQFGHNDQKLSRLKAEGGYRENLKRYITECRSLQMHPVLVTPVARNTWTGNAESYNDLLAQWADSCICVGKEMGAPVLDLHKKSREFLIKKGREAVKPWFYPGDYTHHNDYGAFLMASFIYSEIEEVCGRDERPEYRRLARFLGEKGNLPRMGQPLRPRSMPEDLKKDCPAGDRPAEQTGLLGEREAWLTRAEALDMVLKRAGFFEIEDFYGSFADVKGAVRYASAVGSAVLNGILPAPLLEKDRFEPEKEITLEEFIVFLVFAYQSRRELPEEAPCPYDGQAKEETRRLVRAAWQLGVLAADGSQVLNEKITRLKADQICKSLQIM